MNQGKLKYYFLFVFLGCWFFSSAQLVKFSNLTMADGLSNSQVYCIDQDKYGFIWIGTNSGLNIYDGIHFRHFYHEEENKMSIPGNTIPVMIINGDSVWLGTRNGLSVMDVKTKKCKPVDIGDNEDVRTLFLDKKQQILWVGTNTGLIKYNIKTQKYKEFNRRNSDISHNTIRSLYVDSEGAVWVGTYNKLNRLMPNSTVFRTIELKQSFDRVVKNNLILSILPYNSSQDSLLWIGTQTGLILYNRYTTEIKYFNEKNTGLTNNVIKAMHRTAAGKVWIGTDLGLSEMSSDFSFQTHLHNPFESYSLINSAVWEVFEDNSGALWFGTSNGISILSNTSNRFQFFPISRTDNKNIIGCEVRGVMQDSKGDLWVSTQTGVMKYDLKNQAVKTLISDDNELFNDTKSVFEDSKGRIWIATNGGISLIDPTTNKRENFTAEFNSPNSLRTNYISGFVESDDGEILVNTTLGLHKVIEKEGRIAFKFIGNILIRGSGPDNYWSYLNSNLIRINKDTYENMTEMSFNNNKTSHTIFSLLIADKNIIWLGFDNGLIKYNSKTKEYKIFEIKSNKPFALHSLLLDEKGNVWASSYSAILKFSVDSKEFEIYPSSGEIPINRFLGNSCLKMKTNDLIFGGHDGFIKFSPDKITKSSFIPPVQLTRLYVSNNEIKPGVIIDGESILEEEITFTKDLVLEHSGSTFNLDFSSLHFGNRDGIRYAFLLEGKEKDWHYINDDFGRASYSKLPAGNYKLRLKGTNNDGVWNPNETTLKINIKPPFWAQPIFVFIYIVLLILIIGSLTYYYVKQIKWKSQMKIIRLEKEHTEDIAKNRQQFFTNIAHEFRTPLSLIIGPAEKLAKNTSLDKSANDFVRLIENNARRLLWLNNQLLDFRKVEKKLAKLKVSEFDIIEFVQSVYSLFLDKAERKQIVYSFNTDLNSINVKMDLRKIETILFNLLSNAFKFTSENGEISVNIKEFEKNSKNYLNISVSDTGVGISEKDQKQIFERFYQANEGQKLRRGSGIGLTLVDEYVKMHKGEIILESQQGKGSVFQVILPLNVNYVSENAITTEEESNKPLIKAEMGNGIEAKAENMISDKPYILLVEDDKEIADFIFLSLKDKYNLNITTNGIDALESVSNRQPNLVISDVKMPKMDGIEFTKKLKSNPKTSHIPLILLTGQSQKEDYVAGLKSGADAYVVKPFEIELLELRINNFLKGREKFSDFLKQKELIKPKEVQIVSQAEKVLEKVVICIEKHISDPDLDIEKVCKETGLSHSYLYRQIKKHTGQTVKEFIRTVRIQRAEQLLRTKKITISEVMDETGFSNHSYFSKCFRKVYNVSPREYIEKFGQ